MRSTKEVFSLLLLVDDYFINKKLDDMFTFCVYRSGRMHEYHEIETILLGHPIPVLILSLVILRLLNDR